VQRNGSVKVDVNPQYSGWRDVHFTTDKPVTMDEHVLFEMHAKRTVAGFKSMPMAPFGDNVALVLDQSRDDADTITNEIDLCIAAVNGGLR